MKNITILLFVAMLFTVSCTKEELRINNKELELNENSPEYQVYLAERTMTNILKFQFDDIDNVISKIEDATVKKSLTDSLTKYRAKAEKEALYFKKSDNTTVYLWLGNKKPEERTGVFVNFISNKTNYQNLDEPLQGFEKFPNTTSVFISGAFTKSLIGIDKLSKLKSFGLSRSAYYSNSFYPNRDFEFIPIAVDLSKNTKLEKITIYNYEISNITFPSIKLKEFKIKGGVIHSNDLNNVSTENLLIDDLTENYTTYAIEFDNELKFNNNIDSLSIHISKEGSKNLKSIDVSQTKLNNLKLGFFNRYTMVQMDNNKVEKLILNNGLQNLSLKGRSLKEDIIFPKGLQNIILSNYLLNADLSNLNQLKNLAIYFDRSENNFYDTDKIKISKTIEEFNMCATVNGDLDLSYLNNLKTLRFYDCGNRGGHSYVNGEFKLPNTVNIVDIEMIAINPPSKIVDLSNITNIAFFRFKNDGDKIFTLKLPVNLNEQALKKVKEKFWGAPIKLKKGTIIENKPSWLDKYIEYYD